MKIYTIKSGIITNGSLVEKLILKGANITIPCILVGEKGRGRSLGAIPVQLLPEQQAEWEKDNTTIYNAEIGITRSGKPKLFSKVESMEDINIICIFLTKIGFRGGNDHTGDCIGWKCTGCKTEGKDNKPKVCPECDRIGYIKEINYPFPGEIICRGTIAQGTAGNMGSGEQIVAVMPECIFRTRYTGRLYGNPSCHFYKNDTSGLIGGFTKDERETSEIF